MTLTLKNGTKAEDVVKRMVFLAYQACGGAMGMGVFQEARLGGKSAEEEEVWRCAYNAEDYPCGRTLRRTPEKTVYCDYVFGRMMKWGCAWDGSVVQFRNGAFRGDYQGFAHTYPDDKSLAEAALKSLNITEYELQ